MDEEFENWYFSSRAIDYGCEPTNSQILNKIIEKKAYLAGADMMREKAAEIAEGVPNEWKAKGWAVESSASSMSKDIAAAIRKETGK